MSSSNPFAMDKILIVGDKKVGKSALINRYVNDAFDPSLKVDKQAEFNLKIKFIDGKRCRVSIWDIGSADSSFTQISKLYCRDAVGAIVVFDSNIPETMMKAQLWK